jgi:hypothetical protein
MASTEQLLGDSRLGSSHGDPLLAGHKNSGSTRPGGDLSVTKIGNLDLGLGDGRAVDATFLLEDASAYQAEPERDSPWALAMWGAMVLALIILSSVSATRGCGRHCVWTGGTNGNGTCALPAASTRSSVGACAQFTEEVECTDGKSDPLFSEPSQVLGVLMLLLAFIFSTEKARNRPMRLFYKYVPALFLCYFLPGLMGTAGVYGTHSNNVLYGERWVALEPVGGC